MRDAQGARRKPPCDFDTEMPVLSFLRITHYPFRLPFHLFLFTSRICPHLVPMISLPFGPLPAHTPRRFVPERVDWSEWSGIAPLFDRLETRAAQCQTAPDLERWLLDWSELCAALDEESSRRYIAMTCQTDNAEAEGAYLHFVEQIEPRLAGIPEPPPR